MNRHSAQSELMADVLAEDGAGDLRAAVLGETLRHVRRRRRTRRAVRLLTIVLLIGAAITIRFHRPAGPSIASRVPAPAEQLHAYQLIITQPLPQGMCITTKAFAARPPPLGGTFAEVTTSRDGLRFINDDELLALVADKGGALIRTGPNSEKLIFARPGE
jgi:hypothetical protein